MNLLTQCASVLCALTSLACTVLLWRSHRRTRLALLFWSAAAFLSFTISNLMLILDLAILGPNYDLALIRSAPGLLGVLLLLYGLIRTSTEI